MDRRRWRLVGPVHLAETREQAARDVAHGLEQWVDYFQRVAALPLAPDATGLDELVEALNASGFAVIGDGAAPVLRPVAAETASAH